MTEEENMSVEEETFQGDAQAADSEQNHNDVTKEAQEAENRKRNDAEHNWAEMRRKMREKDHQIDELKQQFQSMADKKPQEEDELANLAEDDILTVAQARKLAQKMARSTAEEVMKQRDAATVDERLQLKFSDYSNIVTKDNIELLKETEPELAQSLSTMTDPYTQAIAAYKLLKKIAPPREETSLEKRKAEENSQKPVSVNAVTKKSPIGNAHLFENGLTPELKKQLWEEMETARKSG